MSRLRINVDGFTAIEFPSEQLARQRIFKLLLDGALQWPRTVDRIEAHVTEQIERRFGNLKLQLAFGQTLRNVFDLDASDLSNLRLVQ